MRKIMWVMFALAVMAVCDASLLQAQATQKSEPQKEEVKTALRTVQAFKLEYSIIELENGKRVNGRNYVVYVTDDGRDVNLKTGSKVPVAVTNSANGSFQYVDIGVNIRPNLVQREGGLFLISQIETNSIASGPKEQMSVPSTPVIRSLEARSSNAVILGKPMLIAGMDDAASSRRYEVEVTVTKQ